MNSLLIMHSYVKISVANNADNVNSWRILETFCWTSGVESPNPSSVDTEQGSKSTSPYTNGALRIFGLAFMISGELI